MEIKQTDEQRTLCVRTTTPVQELSNVMGRVYGRIAGVMQQNGIQFAGAPFALYHNMDMSALDIEIGFPIAPADVERATVAIAGGGADGKSGTDGNGGADSKSGIDGNGGADGAGDADSDRSSESLYVGSIPGGRYVTAKHVGSYETIENTYNAMTAYVQDQKLDVADWCYEVYLNSPEETPPEQLETQIYFPLTR